MRRQRPATSWIPALLVAGLVLAAGPAIAEVGRSGPFPAVALDVQGGCPSAEGLARALAPRLGLDAAAGWRVEVRRPGSGQGTRLRLYAPSGQLAAERTLSSDDCRALGEAFAIIVDRHFVTLGLLAPAREAGAGGSAPAPGRLARPGWLLSVGGGAELQGAPGAAAGLGQLDLSLVGRRVPLQLRLGGAVTSPVEQRAGAEEVLRRTGQIRLDAGYWLGGARWGLVPAVGLTVAISRVEARDLAGSARLRAHPGLGGGLLGLVSLAGPVFARLEAMAYGYLTQDRYTVAPIGEVARSPRLGVILALSIGVHLGR